MRAVGKLLWPFLVALTVGVLGFSWWINVQKRQQKADQISVSVLPAGVQEQWEAYVARRLAKAIVVDGPQLRLTTDLAEQLDAPTVVSINMPYVIDCDETMGGSVDFGSGDNTISVPVFGFMVDDDADPPPALGVDDLSVAAKQLNANLCAIIARYMRAVGEPGEADVKRNWISVFSPSDPTSVSAPCNTKADVMMDNTGSFARIRSDIRIDSCTGLFADIPTSVLFKISHGVLEQVAGKHAVFAIVARSAEEGRSTHISIDCIFEELRDCGRRRYDVGYEKGEFLFDIELPAMAPAQTAQSPSTPTSTMAARPWTSTRSRCRSASRRAERVPISSMVCR